MDAGFCLVNTEKLFQVLSQINHICGLVTRISSLNLKVTSRVKGKRWKMRINIINKEKVYKEACCLNQLCLCQESA